MSTLAITIITVCFTIIVSLVAWIYKRQTNSIDNLATAQNEIVQTLTKKIEKSASEAEQRLNATSKHLIEDINGISKRLTQRIDGIANSVVYTDVFQQFEKTQDARYKSLEKANEFIGKQLEASASSNSQEHGRICGKLDAIPEMIKDQIQLILLASKKDNK